MIRNAHLLNKLNDKYVKKNRRTYKESLAVFEALWREAVSLGKLPLKNPLEGLEKDFRIAKVLNPSSFSKKNVRKNNL